ncbi:MAG: class I SAM-dependent methyltransferase [Bacteroidota bacterium]
MSWYSEWFDSPYYHVLYSRHNENEASRFISRLAGYLEIRPGDRVLDLACGRGRHSLSLCRIGADTTGIDLSPNNIAAARKLARRGLSFAVHDMREVLEPNAFHYVLNLFTSFGYFEDAGNIQVVQSAAADLRKGGVLLIDFMNTPRVLTHLVSAQTVEVEGIAFRITKRVEEGVIIKTIDFKADGKEHHFEERVRALDCLDFMRYFHKSGLRLQEILGNYELDAYDEHRSDRMILIAKKD